MTNTPLRTDFCRRHDITAYRSRDVIEHTQYGNYNTQYGYEKKEPV